MDATSDGVIETGGGAIFHGDLTAARDINIYHFTTQIRQTIQGLSQCCETRDISEGLRTKISTLRSIAETTEDHARALQADVSMNDPRLKISLLECKDVLTELQKLARSIEGGEEGSTLSSVEITECNGVVTDLRGRLSSIQACLSGCEARKIREDHTLIKEALQKWFQEQSNAREPSICSFYTAHSLPAAEREEWHEIEKGLREHGLTPQLIQRHLEFIVESLEVDILDSIPTGQGDQKNTEPRSILSEPLHAQTVPSVEHACSNDLDPSVTQSGRHTDNLLELSNVSSESQAFEVLADPPNAIVDVVFIHFEVLERDLKETWTYTNILNRLLSYFVNTIGKDSKNNCVYWPADLLPLDFDHTRVLAYALPHPEIANAGDQLLCKLQDIRRRPGVVSTRPMIFITYSFGNCILMKALLSQSRRLDVEEELLESTRGIIFMGPPYHAVLGRSYTSIAKMIGMDRMTNWREINTPFKEVERYLKFHPELHLQRLLEPHLQRLQELHEDFIKFLDTAGIAVWTFYNTLHADEISRDSLTSAFFKKKVLHDLSSLRRYNMAHTAYIQADHANMCKFTGVDDPGYQAVRSAIASIIMDIEKVSEE